MFGLQGIYSAPYPHISYHSAANYPDKQIKNLLEQVTPQVTPFCVQTAGLGIFTGARPILYVPVVRSQALDACHRLLFPSLTALAEGENVHYRPERWLPHITLAHSDLSHELLPEVVHYLAQQSFAWELELSNMALVYTDAQEQGLKFQLDFGGTEPPAERPRRNGREFP